jgi:hypothetical protein
MLQLIELLISSINLIDRFADHPDSSTKHNQIWEFLAKSKRSKELPNKLPCPEFRQSKMFMAFVMITKHRTKLLYIYIHIWRNMGNKIHLHVAD